MLVLTRKLGENVLIGDNITVKVINIDNNKVQLGINAPQSVSIYRQELVDRVCEQNRSAVIQKKSEIQTAAHKLKSLFLTKN